MIAKRRHLATLDFLLVTLAAAVVLLLLLPTAPQRRELRLRLQTGQMQSYSVREDDPILARLMASGSSTPIRRGPSAAIAVARWRAETAGIYADRIKPSELLQVSFRESSEAASEAQANASESLRARHAAWQRVREQANERLAVLHLAQQRALETPPEPNFEVGEPIPERRAASAFLLALLGGLAIAAVFAAWAYVTPVIYLSGSESQGSTSATSQPDRAFDFVFAIPRDWVRVRQTMSTQVRRMAQAGLIVAAITMLVLDRLS